MGVIDIIIRKMTYAEGIKKISYTKNLNVLDMGYKYKNGKRFINRADNKNYDKELWKDFMGFISYAGFYRVNKGIGFNKHYFIYKRYYIKDIKILNRIIDNMEYVGYTKPNVRYIEEGLIENASLLYTMEGGDFNLVYKWEGVKNIKGVLDYFIRNFDIIIYSAYKEYYIRNKLDYEIKDAYEKYNLRTNTLWKCILDNNINMEDMGNINYNNLSKI